jgi:hypothetical protein
MRKRGRRPRILKPDEKLLLKEFSEKLSRLVEKEGRSVQEIAKQLKVCRASLYNYLRQTDLAGIDVLERAHRVLGFNFSYMDFSVTPRRKSAMRGEPSAQGVLPFIIGSIQKDDVQVTCAKPVKRETALEVTVQIRFAR